MPDTGSFQVPGSESCGCNCTRESAARPRLHDRRGAVDVKRIRRHNRHVADSISRPGMDGINSRSMEGGRIEGRAPGCAQAGVARRRILPGAAVDLPAYLQHGRSSVRSLNQEIDRLVRPVGRTRSQPRNRFVVIDEQRGGAHFLHPLALVKPQGFNLGVGQSVLVDRHLVNAPIPGRACPRSTALFPRTTGRHWSARQWTGRPWRDH